MSSTRCSESVGKTKSRPSLQISIFDAHTGWNILPDDICPSTIASLEGSLNPGSTPRHSNLSYNTLTQLFIVVFDISLSMVSHFGYDAPEYPCIGKIRIRIFILKVSEEIVMQFNDYLLCHWAWACIKLMPTCDIACGLLR